MVPSIASILRRFTGGWATLLQTDAVWSVTSTWTFARISTCTMSCRRSTGERMTSRICGWCITPVTVRFTVPVRLLGYFDGLSRVRG
jgi:hypothetical protein